MKYRIGGDYYFKVRFIELFDHLKRVSIILLKPTKFVKMEVLEFITVTC